MKRLLVKNPQNNSVNRLVLIDAFAILHRAFHAIPPLTNKKGELTNALYGLISMLLRVVQDLRPTHIVYCFDEKAPTFRHKQFKEYQAQRPTMDKGLESQIKKTREVIEILGIPIYSKPGFEADDLIGTFAKQSEAKINVVIVTGDKDILQLVTEKVKVYMPVVGLSQGRLFGEEEVIEKLGVKPKLIPDYKALVGDPSDNYKGVYGIGPKTAVKLINEFGGIESIYKNLEKIPVKVREKLEKDKKSALLSLMLATIVKNVPVKLDLKKASKWRLDSKEVMEMFSVLGFKTLSERVKKINRIFEEEKQMSFL